MGLWTFIFMIKTCFWSKSLWWSKNWIGFKWPNSLAVIPHLHSSIKQLVVLYDFSNFFKFVSFMSEQISLIKSLLYLSSRRAVLDQPPIACRSFLTEVFSLFAKTLDTAMIRRNTWNRNLLFVCCVLLLADPFLQRFSLSPKTMDTMIEKKYLIQIFAICILRIIAYRRFLSLPKLRIQ